MPSFKQLVRIKGRDLSRVLCDSYNLIAQTLKKEHMTLMQKYVNVSHNGQHRLLEAN
jgi:hypothetical protein